MNCSKKKGEKVKSTHQKVNELDVIVNHQTFCVCVCIRINQSVCVWTMKRFSSVHGFDDFTHQTSVQSSDTQSFVILIVSLRVCFCFHFLERFSFFSFAMRLHLQRFTHSHFEFVCRNALCRRREIHMLNWNEEDEDYLLYYHFSYGNGDLDERGRREKDDWEETWIVWWYEFTRE